METDDINTKPLSDWRPITNPHHIAVLGKLGEEVNELGGIICRCLIQGVNERDPETGKLNLTALSDEIADVRALSKSVIMRLGLNEDEIIKRSALKFTAKENWFDKLAAESIVKKEKSYSLWICLITLFFVLAGATLLILVITWPRIPQ